MGVSRRDTRSLDFGSHVQRGLGDLDHVQGSALVASGHRWQHLTRVITKL